ncbi:MAG: hypothetical protein E6575_24560, partial [Bradyrhizobium sp.]|nr:hypothetical protein [Bradyrhizobium sp.]
MRGPWIASSLALLAMTIVAKLAASPRLSSFGLTGPSRIPSWQLGPPRGRGGLDARLRGHDSGGCHTLLRHRERQRSDPGATRKDFMRGP